MTGRKLLSLCLCLCLVVSTLSVPASALDVPGGVISAAKTLVESGVEDPAANEPDEANSDASTTAEAEALADELSASRPVTEEAQPVIVAAEYINPLYAEAIEASADGLGQSAPVLLSDESVPEPEYVYGEAELDELAQYMREQFKVRAESIVIGFTSDDYTLEEAKMPGTGAELLSYQLWELMEAHTGVPTEGDSIRWQYGSWAMRCWMYDYGDHVKYVFRYTDILYYTTLAQEQELTAEVTSLKTSLGLMDESKSDYEKLCAIYDHLTENVAYDYEHLNDASYTLKFSAYAALLKDRAVCQGYALALYRLALECGIDCRLIPGYGNGEAHGWNIAKLGDSYYYLDATWDAGASSYDYFLKGSDHFGDHLPNSELGTETILAAYPVSEADYDPASSGADDGYVASGTCGEGVQWHLDKDGVLTILGDGAMEDYASAGAAPWYAHRKSIAAVVMEQGVTSVGDYAFYGCGAMTTVSLPDGLLSIGTEAFALCSGLGAVLFPEALAAIGEGAFAGCAAIESVILPTSVAVIGAGAFEDSGLIGIVILNDACSIAADGTALGDPRVTVIHGQQGSSAQHYAKEYGYIFVPDVDVDGDQALTARDIVCLMKIAIGTEGADTAVDTDLNRDSTVDILDVIRLIRVCAFAASA